MQLGEQVGRPGQCGRLGEEVLEVTRMSLVQLRHVATDQGGNQLVTTHADQSVDDRHLGEDAVLVAGTPPGHRVEVGVVHQGAVDIEQDGEGHVAQGDTRVPLEVATTTATRMLTWAR